MSRRLEAEFPASTPRYFHGFDISPAQFPAEAGDDSICFSVQDLLQPFPAEHLNRYDVVHVRLVLGAIPEASYSLAVANLLAILSMLRYATWVDVKLYILAVPMLSLQNRPDTSNGKNWISCTPWPTNRRHRHTLWPARSSRSA